MGFVLMFCSTRAWKLDTHRVVDPLFILMLTLFLSFSFPPLFSESLHGHVVPAFSSRSRIREQFFPPKSSLDLFSLIPGQVKMRDACRWGGCGGCASGWGGMRHCF